MATASRVSVSFKADGNVVSVPTQDIARLMYYLHCVTTGIGLDVLPSDLTDYRNYRQLTTARRSLVFKYVYELSPDLFIDKVIFLDNAHNVIRRGYNNEFCTISAAVSLVSVQQDFLLAGKTQSATRVMFYDTQWLQTHYWGPFGNNQPSIARAIGSLHCLHCNGTSCVCSCFDGCPRAGDTRCRKLDSAAGIDLITDFFETLSTISSPPQTQPSPRVITPTPQPKESKTHNAICDGCSTALSKRYISGDRFKCRVCNNYDLCENCYASNVHDLSHDFSLIKTPGAQPMALVKRNQHSSTCNGCTRTVEGTRYRCKSCDEFDFCKDYYAKKPHNSSHLFKAIEYPGASPISLPARSWLRPPNPPTPAPVPVQQPAPVPTPIPVPPMPALSTSTLSTPAPPTPSSRSNTRSNNPFRTPSVSNMSGSTNNHTNNPFRTPVSDSPSLDPTDLPPPYDESVPLTPFFYHDFSISDLKKYLQERDVTYRDVLDRESLTRRVWDTHVDCMSVPELNAFLNEQNISTVDCVDINSRRQKAKDTFQVSRPAAIVQTDNFPTGQYKIDDTVLLSGLKKAEMNGKFGKVVSIDLIAGRAEVYIEDLGKSFKVKFENVALGATSEDSELLD